MIRPELSVDELAHVETSELAAMNEIAQPLDDWCEFCGEKLATMKTADGVPACASCAEQVIAALKKYDEDQTDLEEYLACFHKGPYFESRAMRRVADRQRRRRNDGMAWGEIRTGSRCR